MKLWFSFVLVVFTTAFTCAAIGKPSFDDNERVKNTAAIDTIFSQIAQARQYDKIIELAGNVIKYRQYYSSNTNAKAFSLLADAALFKGDSAKALQFAQYGVALAPTEAALTANLLLKIAEGYYVNGDFHQVLTTVEQVIQQFTQPEDVSYLLIAYGYQAMAYALIADHTNALLSFQHIERLLTTHQEFSEHIDLLEILALANHYLGDFQTSLEIYLKLLKLRFELSRTENIEQTYYHLASAYQKLGKLDDAYNAYWEAKTYAELKSAPIQVAYAELGLAQLQLQQGKNEDAYNLLIKVEKLSQGQNINQLYLSTLIALAKAALQTNRQIMAYQIIEKAEKLAESIDLTKDQIELYQLLADKYQYQGDNKKALTMLQHFVQLDQQFQTAEAAVLLIKEQAKIATNHGQKLAAKLADESELQHSYQAKFRRQQFTIMLLSIAMTVLAIGVILLWLKRDIPAANLVDDELDKPIDYLAPPRLTKQLYQNAYKKSRKYQYPLTIAYLSIENWPSLKFHFNKKVITEVQKTIGIIINEFLGEFDQAGLINEGEYILLFPYQLQPDVNVLLNKLCNAIKVRFFANLGEFSVIINSNSDTPSVQDIDPFAFLSRLSESLKTESTLSKP